MSKPNPTQIDVIIEHRWRDGRGCNCTWFPNYRNTHKSGIEMHAEHVLSKLADAGYRIVAMDAGSATKWHRVLTDDGSLWMETSDSSEARSEALERGYRLERLWMQREVGEWREVKA